MRKRRSLDISWKLYSLIVGALIVLGVAGFGYAYGGTSPSVMGHSAGEMEVSINGEVKSLEDAFSDLLKSVPIVNTDDVPSSYMAVIGLIGDEATARAACPDGWNLKSYEEIRGGSPYNNILFRFSLGGSYIGSPEWFDNNRNYMAVRMNSDDADYFCWKDFNQKKYNVILTSENPNFECPEGYESFNEELLAAKDNAYTYVTSNEGGMYLGPIDDWWIQADGNSENGWSRRHWHKTHIDKVCLKIYDYSTFPVVITAKDASAIPEGFTCKNINDLVSDTTGGWSHVSFTDNAFYLGGIVGWDHGGENYMHSQIHKTHMQAANGGVTCFKFYDITKDYAGVSFRTTNQECSDAYGDEFTQVGPMDKLERWDNLIHVQKSPHGFFMGGIYSWGGSAYSLGSYEMYRFRGTEYGKNICYKINY